MSADYLMYVASFLYLFCYIPELYANYVNKNANMYNIPEKVIMLIATGCGFSYGLVNQNLALIINYGPMLGLDITALLMRLYYANSQKDIPQILDLEDESVNSVVEVVEDESIN